MKHIDTFSGIGGAALAVDTVWPNSEHVFVEIDPFPQAILKKHWPLSKIHGDIKTFSGKDYIGADILTGGFPCQPFSAAGKRRGTEDDRHLWPEMLRIIRESYPRWIIGENVGGLITWNGGLVLDSVLADLEAEGYEVWPFVIPACAVNAPHRRDRVWIVAHATDSGDRGNAGAIQEPHEQQAEERSQEWLSESRIAGDGHDPDSSGTRLQGSEQYGTSGEGERASRSTPEFHKNVTDSEGEQAFSAEQGRLHAKSSVSDRRSGKHVANAAGDGWIGRRTTTATEEGHQSGSNETGELSRRSEGLHSDPSDSTGIRQRGGGGEECGIQERELVAGEQEGSPIRNQTEGRGAWNEHWFEVATRLCPLDDGLPNGLARPRGWRNAALKGAGNAWVPQVAIEIMKRIKDIDPMMR